MIIIVKKEIECVSAIDRIKYPIELYKEYIINLINIIWFRYKVDISTHIKNISK